jgi:hypothetical protein
MKDNYYPDHCSKQDHCGKPDNCEVPAIQQVPLKDADIVTVPRTVSPIIKVPAVLAERRLQIVVESDIPLSPAATEIKRVKKHVFLDQVKLVPVAFCRIPGTDYSEVTTAKLFVAGYIHKNIEYSSRDCNGALQDRIAKVPFSGFAELSGNDFIVRPILGISENSEANFLNEKTEMDARLDKYFFHNHVKYNEQPYGELVAADFYELDFAPKGVDHYGSFCTLREKIVLDLTVKVLQVQQFGIDATGIVPTFPGTSPRVGNTPPKCNDTGGTNNCY